MRTLQVLTSNHHIVFMLLSCLLCMTYLLTYYSVVPNTSPTRSLHDSSSPSTTINHIVFGIASNEESWSSRKNYVRLWWKPNATRGCVFLDKTPIDRDDSQSLPPICVSKDTARFRYTCPGGLPSAIRIARVVSEIVKLNHSDVRWFVFGDDDTIFFPENLVRTLSKYDHGLWYYIGANSESYRQNKDFSFDMAFGGAGFAISYPLANVLAKVLDSCLDRYPHLYGSDGRIQACLAELGVGLKHEPGFHQMDIRGSMFGFLASHPLSPLVTLHHLEAVDPIFPKMTPIQAIEHLFHAASLDSQRLVQQTVCYDRRFSWTISVSWGYAVQIFQHNVFLPDALRTQETYVPWKSGGISDLYNIDTLAYDPDPCRRPVVFFMQDVSSGKHGITSTYRMMGADNCTFDKASPRKFEEIRVFSHKLELDNKQVLFESKFFFVDKL